MIAAAKQLMIERASEDFRLGDVSARGKVSIGSIYLRFGSKDDLVRAVIADNLQQIDREEFAMVDNLLTAACDLESFVCGYIEAYAQLLERHGAMLRLIMQRAAHDPKIAELGHKQGLRAIEAAIGGMLAYSDEIGGDRKQTKAETAYHIVFATLGRDFGLGTTQEHSGRARVKRFRNELAKVCLAYLRQPQ